MVKNIRKRILQNIGFYPKFIVQFPTEPTELGTRLFVAGIGTYRIVIALKTLPRLRVPVPGPLFLVSPRLPKT